MRALIFVSIAVALSGCGGLTLRYRPRDTVARTARDPATVAVYTLRPSRPYVVVGYLHARQAGTSLDDGPALLAALRDEGARRGCAAVLVDHGYCAEDPSTRYSLRSASTSELEAECLAEVR